MDKITYKNNGNVLFLILIAVALFAALAYAVTSSTRTGGGDASNEKMDLDIASVLNYSASIKNSITRMTLSGGVSPLQLIFESADSLDNDGIVGNERFGVFHPRGGAMTNQQSDSSGGNRGPESLKGTGPDRPFWVFSFSNEVRNVGLNVPSGTVAGVNSAELLALLNNISLEACTKINTKLGISPPIPQYTNAHVDENFPATGPGGAAVLSGVLDGKHEGCFLEDPVNFGYIYYKVIVPQ